jgi:hypothetical protein
MVPSGHEDRSESGWALRLESLRKCPGVIFSDENLFGSPFDAYKDASRRASLVGDTLRGSPFEIVIYLRPQFDWLPSAYLHAVQTGQTTGPEDFWNSIEAAPNLHWLTLIETVQRVSGASRVTLRAFTPRRDCVADFFALCGLGSPPEPGSRAIRENVSITAAQAPLVASLNLRHRRTPADIVAFRDVFQNVLRPASPTTYSPFPEWMQQTILDRYREDWRGVSEYVARHDADEARRFSAEFDRWSGPVAEFAGRNLGDTAVQEEALRSLSVLAIHVAAQPPRPEVSVLRRLLRNPRGVRAALARRLSNLKGQVP